MTKTSSSRTQLMILKGVGEALLMVLCIVPGIVFSAKTLQEPWTMFRIARAILSLQEDQIVTFVTSATGYRSEHIGGEMLQIALLGTTGWPLESIGLIPIGSLLLALLYYAISRCVSRSPWTAAAITLYASWYYPRLYSQFGAQTYAWTNVLFLSFLILLLYRLRDSMLVLSVLIMLIFTATFLHYHTTPLWIIAAMIASVAATKLRESEGKTLQTGVSWALPLFCAVLYLGFDTVIYGNGLARLRTEASGETFIQSFMNKIITPLFSRSPGALGAFEVAPTNPGVATWSTFSVLMLLTVPVGIWCVVKAYRAVRARDIGVFVRTPGDVFVWTVILVAIVHALTYLAYGALSLRVIPLAFPLILPFVVGEFGPRFGRFDLDKVEIMLTSALAVFAITGFLSFTSASLPDMVASETGLVSKLFDRDSLVMGRADVYGSLLLNTAEDGKVVDFVWIDSKKYSALVGQRTIAQEDDFDYVVVDTSDKPIFSLNWGFFEPWTQRLPEINRNSNLNKIYDSGKLMLFQPRGADLPSYRVVSEDVGVVGRAVLSDAFWLFLAIVSLFFIPGAVFVFVICDSFDFHVDDIRTLVGLAVGASITFVTFVGYIANFTPLGLRWFVPLCVIVPWGVLGAYLVMRRPRFRFRLPWVVYGLSVLITLVVGSLWSAEVAQARSRRGAGFTEFFVTQHGSGTITANVVNRLSRSENFALVFELDGIEAHTVGPKLLAPNSLWVETWQIPPTWMDGKLVISLERDGTLYRELHLSELEWLGEREG